MLTNTMFKGTWTDRLHQVFHAGVTFKNKTILDVGCNMGIVGYEICKDKPAYYHGVERLPELAAVAGAIFLGVDTPNVIQIGDITEVSNLERHYDVVLYLAVHQHIRNLKGSQAASRVARDLFNRCDALIFRGPDLDEIKEYASEAGFIIGTEFTEGTLFPLCSFIRQGT